MATAEALANNPNAGFFDQKAPTPSAPPSPISVNGMSQTQTPANIPPTPTVDTGVATNASIPSPIPTTQDVVTKDTQPTSTQGAQSDILNKVSSLMQGKTSLATLQTTQESDAGVPALTKTVNDLNTQIQGLADQSTALQNDASPYGSINATQLAKESGGNLEAAMNGRPMTREALLENSIKQSQIASQSLTLKSAVYAAQGNLTLAKNAADKAAQVQFDATQQQIDYANSLLAAIQPQLDRESKAQAAQLQADLADRQTQINNQREDYKTGQAAIADALKNNPTDANAHNAAVQAANLDPKDPQYLQKVQQLVAPYASDVAKRALDMALTKGQIAQQPIEMALKVAQLRLAQQQLGAGTPDINAGLTPQQQQTLQTSGFTKYNPQVQSLAQQLVTGLMTPDELSKRSTGQAPYNTVITAAQAYSQAVLGKPFNFAQAGIDAKFANNPQTKNTLNFLVSLTAPIDAYGNANTSNLDELIKQSNERMATAHIGSAGQTVQGSQGFPALNNVKQWTELAAGDPQIAAYYTTVTEVADQVAKILQGGGSGAGTSDAKLEQAQSLFQRGFTPDQISAVASSLKPLLTNRAKGMIGSNPYLADYANQLGLQTSLTVPEPSDTSKGTVWNRPDGKYVSDGTQWVKQ